MPVAMLAVELGTARIWYAPPEKVNAVVWAVPPGSKSKAPTVVVPSLSYTWEIAAPG